MPVEISLWIDESIVLRGRWRDALPALAGARPVEVAGEDFDCLIGIVVRIHGILWNRSIFILDFDCIFFVRQEDLLEILRREARHPEVREKPMTAGM
jgi:hypothetical protein